MRRDMAVEVKADSTNVTEGESTLGPTARYEVIASAPVGLVVRKEPGSYSVGGAEPQRAEAVDWQRVDRALRTLEKLVADHRPGLTEVVGLRGERLVPRIMTTPAGSR